MIRWSFNSFNLCVCDSYQVFVHQTTEKFCFITPSLLSARLAQYLHSIPLMWLHYLNLLPQFHIPWFWVHCRYISSTSVNNGSMEYLNIDDKIRSYVVQSLSSIDSECLFHIPKVDLPLHHWYLTFGSLWSSVLQNSLPQLHRSFGHSEF